MRRTTVALLAALEALVSALVGYGIALVPLMLLWGMHFQLGLGLDVVFRAAADVWLLGHGVDLTVQLDAVTAARTGVPGAEAAFPITIALLGFALLTLLVARRIGRRAVAAGAPVAGLVAAVVVSGGVGLVATLAARHPAAHASLWQGALLPAAITAAGVVIGLLSSEELRDRLLDRLPAPVPDEWLELAGRAWRVGVGSAFAVLAVAGLVVAWAIVSSYATITGLHQVLGAGFDGGVAIFVAELALLPNLVLWGASWLLGPGFAIGTGTQVTPAGTLLGPVPGLPIAGALPSDGAPMSALWLLVPVLAAFVGAYLVTRIARQGADASAVLAAGRDASSDHRAEDGRRPEPDPGSASAPWWHPLVVGLAAGVLAGLVLGLGAWWSGGAIGPGRLADTGPNGWAVAGVAALTVAVGAVVGGFTARARTARRASPTESAAAEPDTL
ncbi:DUF6350 family protein [Agromyces mediolanus]|uniref:Uncharacterized protein n=1 Tax=Agromyces mediolanus TaxID=41986 RepID=A0A918CDQ1_AGRME|nr:DUF6350 family protein [Agromyces mediolanus]GGR15787.1 hypothetical protein GCM10010196_05640 [Agromyces mediolanus]GLJ73547.1 hypothetical protein GCM10017583_28060 [Agromyces mediolanus]